MQYRHNFKPKLSKVLLISLKARLFRTCFSLFRKPIKLVALLALVVSLVISLTPLAVSAQKAVGGGTKGAIKTSSLQPSEQASAFAYFKALRSCMTREFSYQNAGGLAAQNSMSQQNAINFEWFDGLWWQVGGQIPTTPNAVNIGAFNDPRGLNGDGSQNCGDSEGKAWIAKAAGLWGYDGVTLLCALGFTRQSTSTPCTDTTAGVTNDFYAPPGRAAALDALWQSPSGFDNSSLGIASITDTGGAYRLYLGNFMTQCRPSIGGNAYTIREYDQTKKEWSDVRYGAPDRDRGTGYSVTVWDQQQMTCAELAAAIDKNDDPAVQGYQAWLDNNNGEETGTPEFCAQNPSACPDDNNTTTCGVEGIGWIICPVFNFLSGVADGTYGLIEGFLVTDIRVVDTSSGTYTAWQAMRNFANVGFVIIFLIIVFSQLTGAGITNYGVKKMLPRLVVAAILVNVSFFITQLAVDLSNILGGSLRDALDLPVFDTFDGGLGQVLGQGNTFTDVANGVLAAQLGAGAVAGAAVAIYFGGIGLLIPVILAAVVAVIMTLLILIARQAIVILLIVVSPLAFLAMLLPNTENLFKQWRKILVSMLILYPAVALLFAGSQLAAAILIQSLADDNVVGKLSALAVMILPLFALPAILKGSLNAVPAIGGLAQKLANGAISGTRKGSAQATKALGQRAAAGNSKFAQFASRSLYGRSREGRNRQSSARRAYEEPRIKDIQDRWADQKILNDADALMGVVQAKGASSIEGKAAIGRLAQMGSTDQLVKIRRSHLKNATDEASYDRATRDYFSTLKAKDMRAVYPSSALFSKDPVTGKEKGKWSEVKGVDLHNMSDAAIDEGWASGSNNFRSTLMEVLTDPEQSKNINKSIREKYAQYMTVVGEQAQSSSTQGGSATPNSPASPLVPPPGAGSGPGGLVVPHDDPNNPFFSGSRKP
ncbi:MAG: hypothetical protein WAY85_02950 [Candidatus Microsaccharimonas sp.]